MRKIMGGILLMAFLSFCGCDTNKPADDVKDAQDRVKENIEDAREDQKEAAEETGEATPDE